jgi:hypothetical protein
MSNEHTTQQFVLFHKVYSEHPVLLFAMHPFPHQTRLGKFLTQDDCLHLSLLPLPPQKGGGGMFAIDDFTVSIAGEITQLIITSVYVRALVSI